MKKNNSYLDDEIDLREIIKTLWNEKILILSISLVFMVIGYVYGALQPKIYKTEITIREAPSSFQHKSICGGYKSIRWHDNFISLFNI
jgi:LPS O-antigen subunit length determinant protein (WzzB/FepE family)